MKTPSDRDRVVSAQAIRAAFRLSSRSGPGPNPSNPPLSEPDSPSQGFASRDREAFRARYVKHQAMEDSIRRFRTNPTVTHTAKIES